jgi:hypothetical protein
MFLFRHLKRHSRWSFRTKLTDGFTFLLLALCTFPVGASVITYTYTGNDYTGAVAPVHHKYVGDGIFHLRIANRSQHCLPHS